ncbi:RNA-binding protein MEX3A, partial [Sarcoptes scabiei]
IFLSYFKLVFFYLFIFFFCFTQIVFKIEMTDLIDSYYNCPKLWPLPTDLFNEVCMNGSFEKQSNSFATLTPTPNQNLFDFDSDGSNSGFTTSSITPVTSNRTSPIFFPETDYESFLNNLPSDHCRQTTLSTNSLLIKRSEKLSKQNNYCETVAVESSAHVAQIVGKNGSKIKHLRAKFGTYIHTPSAHDEPVFIIKGQRDKVLEVKQEIIKADNHFSNIKEARNSKIAKMIDSKACYRLFIPIKYIGLVVGRNGWFVKNLQSKYQIHIETPKFDLCNYFQLYGQRERLHIVKELIFEHILKKTGIRFNQKQESDDVFFIE